MSLNLNLKMFGLTGLILILYYAFLGRGLYFKPELLAGLVLITVIFLFAAADVSVSGATDFYRFPVDYLITALALVYLAAGIGAVSRPDAAMGVLKYTGYLMVFFITCQSVRTWRSYRVLLEFVFAGAVLVTLVGLLSVTGHFNFPGAYENKQILSTFQYQNGLAIFLTVASLIGISLWNAGKKSSLWDLWYIAGLFLMNITILGTYSRAIWIMYPLMLLIWIFGLQQGRRLEILIRFSYVLITSVLVSRGFFSLVGSGQGPKALLLLQGWLLITLAGWVLMHRVNRSIRRKHIGREVKKFWQGVGIVYLIAVLGIYSAYAVNNLAGGWDAVIPASVTGQLVNISGQDSSYLARGQFAGDALKIVRDYPLLGTGAGGWNALYLKYRTLPYDAAEVHNNYLQVMVETGIPGFLIYISIWGVTFYTAYRLYRNFRKDARWPLVWGVLVGLLAIALHSSFDFDLSLPTLSIFTWMLWALVRNARILARRDGAGLPLGGGLRWLPLLAGLIIAVAVAIPAYRLYQAGELGAQGAVAMAAGQIGPAEEKMRAAMQKDPYSGSYLADIAKLNIVLWLQKGDQENLASGIAMARQAVAKEPHNFRLKENLIQCYLSAGMINEALKEVRQLAADIPLEIKVYEMLANISVESAMYYRQQGDAAKAQAFLRQTVAVPVQLEKRAGQVAKRGIRGYWYARRLEMTPKLNIAVGQAYLMTGRSVDGTALIEKAVADKETGQKAAAWLAAVHIRNGDQEKADRMIKKWSEKNRDFAASVKRAAKALGQK